MGARVVEIGHDLSAEAVFAYAGHGPFHTGLVPGAAHAGGVDDEAAGLGVLEEGRIEPRLQRVRALDDRFRVVGDQDAEDPVKERPGGLAGLDRRLGRLAEDWVDEAVAREDRGEDPRAEAPTPAGRIRGHV